MSKKKKVKNIIQYISDLLVRLINAFDKNGSHFMSFFIRSCNYRFDIYFLFRKVPKSPHNAMSMQPIASISVEDVAIVLQGVVETKNNFTLETVRYYKLLFPGAVIIVSTWDFTDEKDVAILRSEGCIVLLNKSFEPTGIGNVNYQICTSLAGIRKAKEVGATYCIKTRCDQRIHRNTALSFIKSLINTYPVNGEIDLRGRIVTFSGALFLPLYFTDFLFGGFTEDLEKLFDIPYDTRNIPRSQKYYGETYGPTFSAEVFYSDLPPEVYIIDNFLKKYMKTEYTVKFYWDIINKYFITIDHEDIGLLWPKYSFELSQWSLDQNTYGTFLALYNNEMKYKEEYEEIRRRLTIDVSAFM